MFDRYGVESSSPIGVRGGALAVGVHAAILAVGLHSHRRPADPSRPVSISVVYSAPTTRVHPSDGGLTVATPGPITISVPTLPTTFDPGSLRPAPFAPSLPVGPGVPLSTDTLAPYVPGVVDQVPELLSSPPPRYPELLRQAHIEGEVMIEGVVDTLGHMERGTLRVMSSPHPALSASATECLSSAVFRPGRVNGRAVRVLIMLPVRFTVARR